MSLSSVLSAGASVGGAKSAWTTVRVSGVSVDVKRDPSGLAPVSFVGSLSQILSGPVAPLVGAMLEAAGEDDSPEGIAAAATDLSTGVAATLAARTPGVSAVLPTAIVVRVSFDAESDAFVGHVGHGRSSGRTVPLARIVGQDLAQAVVSFLVSA